MAVFPDIPKPTVYRWMQQDDLPYEDCGGLTDCHISIEDTMRVKAAKRPGHPKKRDAERVGNRPVNYELGGPVRHLAWPQSHNGDPTMKSNNILIGLSILFFVLAAALSLVFGADVSLAAKIGFFVLGFGSGVTAGQWFARRSA